MVVPCACTLPATYRAVILPAPSLHRSGEPVQTANRQPPALQIPMGLEAAHSGVVDLVHRRAYTFEGPKGENVRHVVDYTLVNRFQLAPSKPFVPYAYVRPGNGNGALHVTKKQC